MRFRQVHLDFHTSEHIPEIGADFSKEQFQAMLKEGHIDSITVFSKCHHGWAYHPSKANVMHPHLNFDLFGAQIEAAHEIGVNAVGYLSAGYDEKLVEEHPEWITRRENEQTYHNKDFSGAGWHLFCMNSPYLEVLLEQVRETVSTYDIDGLFLDIVGPRTCYCRNCARIARTEGKDLYDKAYNDDLAERTYANYTRKVKDVVEAIKPGLPIFHNQGRTPRGRRDMLDFISHVEIESLPTGGWGYDNLPTIARYVQPIGKSYLGMTGKFHGTWGEFGGYKHENALRYEMALTVAHGAKCSIGDQLHPRGKMDPETYRLIGKAYAEVEAKEPWLDGVHSISDIALFSYDAWLTVHPECKQADADRKQTDLGARRILSEGHYLFDIVDYESDLTPYKLVILPDLILIDDILKKKLDAYLKSGGKIMATGTSGLLMNAEKPAFAFDFGVTYEGKREMIPTFMTPTIPLKDMGQAGYVLYNRTEKVTLADGKVLATMADPYFERNHFHFCSHQHAPEAPVCSGVGACMGKDGAYVAFPFREYAMEGHIFAKRMMEAVIDACMGDGKSAEVTMPAAAAMTLMDQEQENRLVLHLVYAPTNTRGQKKLEIIEDIVPLYNIPVRVKNTGKKIKNVYLAPSGEKLTFEVHDNGDISFTVPKVDLHAMAVLDYEA